MPGVISLRKASVSALDSASHWGGKFPNLLCLTTPTRKYFLSDRNIASSEKWLEVLEESISLNSEGMLTVENEIEGR